MLINGISLSSKSSLQAVSEQELKRSIYQCVTSLDVLYQSVIGMADCVLTQDGPRWQDSPEHHLVAESSLMWSYLHPMWVDAEQGLEPELNHLPNDIAGDIAKWLSATQGISQHDGINLSEAALKVLIKYFARLKLDHRLNLVTGENCPSPEFERGICAIRNGWFPQVHAKHLTLVELGLLAGVTNLRTIRNAQYDQDAPLAFIKCDNQVLIQTDEARRWLKRRRGFVPSKLSADALLD